MYLLTICDLHRPIFLRITIQVRPNVGLGLRVGYILYVGSLSNYLTFLKAINRPIIYLFGVNFTMSTLGSYIFSSLSFVCGCCCAKLLTDLPS